jgi:oligopeptide transport system permease protein
MLRYIAKRILETIPVLFIISTITFFMVHLMPGTPFDSEKATTPEIRKQLMHTYRLDLPLPQQYLHRMDRLWLHGDFGVSTRYGNRTVNEIIAEAFPVSLRIGSLALAFALFFGLLIGVVAPLRPNTVTDYVPMSFATLGICLPTFVLGPLLIYVFALKLQWFNPSGWSETKDIVLPALTLGIFYSAYVARLARGGMLEVLNLDYVRTARAKGASASRVVLKHALRGGILPVISFLGPAIAGLVTGSFAIEKIFDVPGIGQYFVTAASNRDYGLIEGLVVFFAVLVIAMNLLVDIALVWLNPKLRFE